MKAYISPDMEVFILVYFILEFAGKLVYSRISNYSIRLLHFLQLNTNNLITVVELKVDHIFFPP